MNVREELAAYAHDAWAGWMKYMLGKCYRMSVLGHTLCLIMPRWAIKRWQRQMNAPYADLPEDEKENDRAEADKMLAITAKHELLNRA